MIEAITISKDLPEESALNYDFLRAEGIKHIQQLAGHIWTDHNTHDPGITILEQLCYAITDLSYRVDNDIQNLLGRNGASSFEELYGPASILTVNPVTLLDLRKVVIDVPGVKNAWVEKVSAIQEQSAGLTEGGNETLINPKGLYRVVFEKDESTKVNNGLLGMVKARLQACRGICEDFEEVKLLDSQFIRLHGTIEVGQVEDLTRFVAEIMLRAASYISPKVPFYSMQELLEKGMQVDEIFDGPALEHGFIDNQDLLKTNRRLEIHTSDLIREIMDQKEVLAVNEMSMSTGSETVKNWALPLDMSKTPRLDVRETLKSLEFAKQGLKASIDFDRAYQLYREMRDEQLFDVLPQAERDIVLPETEDRELEKYFSVQNHFPSNYGVGSLGLSEAAPAARKAQAKQLKSYLLFFEQLLANYFSQAAHFKDLLGFDGEDRRTYFNQSLLETIPGLEEVVVSEESYKGYLEEMNAGSAVGLERKNMFLNHLLARFSEAFTDYGMLLHDPKTSTQHSAAQKLIVDKANFLKDYPALSSGRAKGFDYTQGAWANENISGLEKRIARKLGIADYTRKNIGEGDQEGFHLVEHILLRPGRQAAPTLDTPEAERTSTNDVQLRDLVLTDAIATFSASTSPGQLVCEVAGHGLLEGESIEVLGTQDYNGIYQILEVTPNSFEIEQAFATEETGGRWRPTQGIGDVYSLQLTFVFPDWASRYQDGNFKHFVENMVREETPAHLTIYVQWLDKPQMQRFDQAFQGYLTELNQK